MHSYRMPDLLDPALLIAAYEDTLEHKRHLIVYEDQSRHDALDLTYLTADSVISHRLAAISSYEFYCPDLRKNLIIHEKKVYIVESGEHCDNVTNRLVFGKSYARTDTLAK